MESPVTDQFHLKWTSYGHNLSESFESLRSRKELFDVTLTCGAASIGAHKTLLSACSLHFRDMFIANPCKHPIIILQNVLMSDLQNLMDFVYSGEVNVDQENINSFLKLAELLKIKGLTTDTNKKLNQDLAELSEPANHSDEQDNPGDDAQIETEEVKGPVECNDSGFTKVYLKTPPPDPLDTSDMAIEGGESLEIGHVKEEIASEDEGVKIDDQKHKQPTGDAKEKKSKVGDTKMTTKKSRAPIKNKLVVKKKTKTRYEKLSPEDSETVKANIIKTGEKYSCKFCRKEYTTMYICREHVKGHLNPFTCETCFKTFNFHADLRKHIKMHEHETKCKICFRTFSTLGSLKVHEAMHAGSYRCPVCSKDFKSPRMLKIHQESHNGSTTCTLCKKVFSSPSNLKCHMASHEGKTICKLCNKTFSKIGNLNVHLKVCHPDEELKASADSAVLEQN